MKYKIVFLCSVVLMLASCQVWVETKTVTFKDAPLEGVFEGDWNTMLNQLINYLQTQGQVKKIEANSQHGLVQLVVQGSKVNVTMDKTTTEQVRVSVSADQNGVPKVDVAKQVYTNLEQQLNKPKP